MKKACALATMLVAAVPLTGCSSGGDDDDDDGTADFLESEPNDSFSEADDIGAAVTFGGSCDDTADALDYFLITIPGSSGTLTVSAAWSEGGGANDIDVELYDPGREPLDDDSEVPPGDAPAEVSAAVTESGDHFVLVFCIGGSAAYIGTVTRP